VLRDMHRRKTGALLQGSVLMGAACGGWTRGVAGAGDYGAAIGLAFQVVDDILDVTQASATLGKTAGKDQTHNKPTYVSCWAWSAAPPCPGAAPRPMAALARSGLGPTPPLLALLADMVVDLKAEHASHSLLKTINSPADLRRLSRGRTARLADELRDYVLHSVSQTGGHLSSNLGTVELTVALHYVFNTPTTAGVGRGPPDLPAQDPDRPARPHAHAAPAGRHQRLSARDESEYDTFGTGHSVHQHLALRWAWPGAPSSRAKTARPWPSSATAP
jgi:hypothetical protein